MGDIPYIAGMVINELGKPTKLVPILVSRNDNNTLARAYLGSDQPGVASATPTKVLLDTEDYDEGNNFASYKYVFPVSGKYHVDFGITGLTSGAHLTLGVAYLYLDGALRQQGNYQLGTVHTSVRSVGADDLKVNAGQYIELYGYGITDSGTFSFLGLTYNSFMSVHLIST